MTLDIDLPPERGDIVPHVSFKTGAGGDLDIWDDDVAGSFLIIIFCGRDTGAADALIAEIASKRGTLKAMGAKCLAVATRSDDAPRFATEPPFQLVIDPEGAGYKAFGLSAPRGSVVDAAPSLFLVAPNMHLLAAPDGDGGPRLDTIFADMRRWADRRRPFPSVIHPPALFVPDVLSREDCAWLREVYDTEGQEFVEPGHMALDGRTTDAKMKIPEYGREDRVDHWVVDPDTQAFIDDRLSRRLFPEIQKAFQYRITKHERYRIATYEGDRGGEAHGHRDNSTAQVAYRRFAVTINLNAEEYDGGELRFPEFSDQLYKPASGMAIAFSCSLLHEVMHMRRGRRYALLAFVFGDV